jgi:hypothetical protein
VNDDFLLHDNDVRWWHMIGSQFNVDQANQQMSPEA